MNKISIVVPVYKVEDYLDRCIVSLTNQTYKNIEIILVDDGSPDNCPTMCDDWASKDSRIKVVHKVNGGLGYARNSGLEVATGQFVMFVDSDDYIDIGTCEILVNILQKTSADICVFDNIKDYNGKISKDNLIREQEVYENQDIINVFLPKSIARDEKASAFSYIGMSACRAIYKLSMIKNNNINFYSEREFLNEDLLFRIDVCKHIKKAVMLPEHLYYYCYNGESLSRSYREDRFECSLRMDKKLKEELLEYINIADINNRCRMAFMINLIACLKQEVVYLKDRGIQQLKKKYLQIVNNEVVLEAVCKYPINKLPIQQRLLFKSIKYKKVVAIFILVWINNFIKGNGKKVKNIFVYQKEK